MDKFYHSVRLDPILCKGCINCIKRCPTQTIRMRDGKTQINREFYIDCGECIRAYPHHVKHATYGKLDVMKQHEYTVALPAPSLYGQFSNPDDVNIVLNGLLLMGFDDVSEVGTAAEIVPEATRSHLMEHEDQLPVISTACPSVVRLIQVRFPNLVPHLLPLNPPVEVAACMAVERAMKKAGPAREEIGIIFISSYPSKMTYVKPSLGIGKSEVGHVLAIREAYPQLLPYIKVVGEDEPEIGTPGKTRVSWGRSGGEASGLFTKDYLAMDGTENVIRVLEDLENQKLPSLKLVELNTYNGGCVGDVLTVENPCVAEAELKRLHKYMLTAKSHVEANTVDCVPWTTGVQFEPVSRLGDNVMESFPRLERAERLCKKFPGLGCGSCETPAYRALAEDIVHREANEKDRVHFLRDNLHSLPQEVAILADDLADGDEGGTKTLNILEECIQYISDEMTVPDSRVREK